MFVCIWKLLTCSIPVWRSCAWIYSSQLDQDEFLYQAQPVLHIIVDGLLGAWMVHAIFCDEFGQFWLPTWKVKVSLWMIDDFMAYQKLPLFPCMQWRCIPWTRSCFADVQASAILVQCQWFHSLSLQPTSALLRQTCLWCIWKQVSQSTSQSV